MPPRAVTPLSVRATLGGRHVLLTGLTGFVGKVWALEALHRLPGLRITALVRPRGGTPADRRLADLLARTPALRPLREAHGAALPGWLAERLDVLPGDVGQPGCGVAEHALDALRGRVDLVLHCAGLTDFQPDPTQAVAANVRGALHAAELATALGVPMVHVSTAYVAGRVDGRIPETLDPRVAPSGATFEPAALLDALEADLAHLPADRAARGQRVEAAMVHARRLGWPNIYTLTKGLAERLLLLDEDLDVTVVRPTIVECARRFPFPGWNEGLNTSAPLAWLISTAFRDFPSRAHHHFDIAPVDLVSRGITLAAAAALDGRGGGVMHLGTSGSHPVTFGRIIELTGLANRRRLRESPDASPLDRAVAHLDPIATDADRRPLWHVSRLHRASMGLKRLLDDGSRARLPGPVHRLLGEPLRRHARGGSRKAAEAARMLRRVETMLEQYRPFTHDHDQIFENGRIRALSDGLPADERDAFGWDDHTLDWRHYWYDVEYPGLWTWSIPLLWGQEPPSDPPLTLHLDTVRAEGRPTSAQRPAVGAP
jgi:nucleoside-diphosphate-sugar epimerase